MISTMLETFHPAIERPALSCSMIQPTPANKPDGYLLGSYRIAIAPELNSSRLTSFKSICFESPANNVGPWPANLGCTTNSYSSINSSSAKASGNITPPVNNPLPDSRLSFCTDFPRSPRTSVPIDPLQSARHHVLLGCVDGTGEGRHPRFHPIKPHPRPCRRSIRINYIQPGKPQQNAYVERYNRTVRYVWLNYYLFDTIQSR